jgi:hypothetical protein
LKFPQGDKSIEAPRSPWEHYRNLKKAGYPFDIMQTEKEIPNLSKYLLDAPRPDNIHDTSSGQGYKTLSHYILDRAMNESASDNRNLVTYFKHFVVRHLQVIDHFLQDNREPFDRAWFGGSSASAIVSKSALANHAHFMNAAKVSCIDVHFFSTRLQL